jgi:hypothetical protein
MKGLKNRQNDSITMKRPIWNCGVSLVYVWGEGCIVIWRENLTVATVLDKPFKIFKGQKDFNTVSNTIPIVKILGDLKNS